VLHASRDLYYIFLDRCFSHWTVPGSCSTVRELAVLIVAAGKDFAVFLQEERVVVTRRNFYNVMHIKHWEG
jgi:phage antirepressor YoqD-like protein